MIAQVFKVSCGDANGVHYVMSLIKVNINTAQTVVRGGNFFFFSCSSGDWFHDWCCPPLQPLGAHLVMDDCTSARDSRGSQWL